MTPRVVLDTSVLLSAERHELIFLAHRQIYTMVWSSFLVAEVVRIRTEWGIKHQQERARYRQGINNFVHELSRIAELVDYTLVEGGSYHQWLKDPDDEPLLATALVGGAQYIVSWNTRDFPPRGSFAGVRYLTPPTFLAELYMQYPEQQLHEAFSEGEYRLP